MIRNLRSWYNESFTDEKYKHYCQLVEKYAGEAPLFHLAETPVFIPHDFKVKLVQACNDLIDATDTRDYYKFSDRAIPEHLHFPGDPGYSPILIYDFGVCEDDHGRLIPQLIEMQGFPSLFCFQVAQANAIKQAFGLPEYLNNYIDIDEEHYISLLKKVIIGDSPKEEVILLDHKPEEQKTKVDFAATKKILGIEAVCVTKLKQDGKKLYYEKDSKRQYISRIYNRLIFEEFFSMKVDSIDLRQEFDVTWIPHPNWFCRVSKYSMPFIKSDYVPETTFLSELKSIPDDLSNFVLKPLYSYAGMGVKIDIARSDIEAVKDPENWILQKKVHYHPTVITPDVPAKCEIRMMVIQDGPDKRPQIVNNLARLSKGKMIGVRYNAGFTWVGSSICFFE